MNLDRPSESKQAARRFPSRRPLSLADWLTALLSLRPKVKEKEIGEQFGIHAFCSWCIIVSIHSGWLCRCNRLFGFALIGSHVIPHVIRSRCFAFLQRGFSLWITFSSSHRFLYSIYLEQTYGSQLRPVFPRSSLQSSNVHRKTADKRQEKSSCLAFWQLFAFQIRRVEAEWAIRNCNETVELEKGGPTRIQIICHETCLNIDVFEPRNLYLCHVLLFCVFGYNSLLARTC